MSISQANVPVFMRRARPETTSDPSRQSEIDRITREAKSNGAVLYEAKQWQKAKEEYMKGAVVNPSDPDLRKAILLNLAATNLQLGNWHEVLYDTTAVLMIDPSSVKAFFRSARALFELKRFEEALDCCDRGLKLEPHNLSLREEHRKAREETIKRQHQLILKAYEHHHIRILPTYHHLLSGPTTAPSMLPFFDPPTPSDPLTAPLFCNFNFRYAERFAGDMISEFPSDKPILPLLDTLLPGPPDASKPASRTQNNLTYNPNPLSPKPFPIVINHPTSWDPQYEFRRPMLSVYADTAPVSSMPIVRNTVKKLTDKTRLVDLFNFSRKSQTYLRFTTGMVELVAFRTGSEAEQRFLRGAFDETVDLGNEDYDVGEDLGISTNLRNRLFTYGPEKKAVNQDGSTSLAARERIVHEIYAH